MRAWGPSDIPITYDLPVKELERDRGGARRRARRPGLFVCWMQKAPARQLVNLKNIPVMVMAAEASYQVYDHCAAKYLNQAGVKTEYPAAGQGHPRQRPHGDDREEQSRHRAARRRVGGRTCADGVARMERRNPGCR